MHAPLAKFSMMRQLMSSAAWWLNSSAIDIDFENNRAHDGIPVDPLRASTVLMLHGDGVDGSTNISDSTGRHFVVNGGAEIDTAQSKFGGAAILLGFDQLTLDGSSDFAFGTGDFTIDFWMRPDELTNYRFLYSAVPTGDTTATYPELFIDDSTDKLIFRRGAADSAQITGTTTIVVNTWYHVALVRSSGSTKLFLNGTQEGSTFSDSTNYTNGASRPLISGSGYNESLQYSGHLEEYRVLKGAAAWTTTFTPPTMPYNVGVGPYDLLSCSRASIGYAQTAAGTLTQFAANQLRITDLGLLVEDARTNGIAASQTLDNATYWAPSGASISADATAAPDGTTTADKLVEDGTTGTHLNGSNSAPTFTAGAYVTLTAYCKAAGRTWLWVQVTDFATGGMFAEIDLSTGAVSSAVNGEWTNQVASSEALANGWYRWTLTGKLGATRNSASPQYRLESASGVTSYAGDSTSGAYIWGVQLEEGTFASSYIPTTTTAVTRAKDAITPAGNLQAAFAGFPEASVVEEVKFTGYAAGANYTLISQGGDKYLFFTYPTDISTYLNGGANTSAALGNSLSFVNLDTVKIGASWDHSAGSLVGGGGTVNTGANANMYSSTYLIGDGGLGVANHYLHRLSIWSERLSDTALQALTAPGASVPTTYAVDLNFQTGAYTVNPRPQFYLSCSRASIGYAQTAAGTLTQFAANQLRVTDQGLLIEDARTNVVLWNRDLTNAAWTASNITAVKDQTGPDGVANSASKITASAGNGTILQAITLASSARYQSAWVKRITGSGTINMTMDNGSTWTAITVTAGWTLVEITTQTLANPTVGFRIVTSGDAIAVDFVQNEDGAFASSPIPTTTAAATRALDVVACIGNLSTVNAGAQASIVVDLKTITQPGDYWRSIGAADNPFPGLGYRQTWAFAYDGATPLEPIVIGGGATAVTGAKVGLAWDVSGRSGVAGGGTVLSDANDNPILGSIVGSGNAAVYGYFRRLSVWTERLADATLQGFTNP